MKRRKFIKNTLITSTGIAAASPLTTFSRMLVPIEKDITLTTISSAAPGVKFSHFWSKCVGAGRANEGLRATWLEQLKLAKQFCGFEFCRFHGLFHDDMFVYKETHGMPVYNWQYIDDLFDRMLEIGVRPFVELGFCPADMASDDKTVFWYKGRISPPKDFKKWADLVSEFTRHCVLRYGIGEVRQWYFEVWNEPNGMFWSGTKSQYFELYKSSVLAIKKVDSKLKVGGPATSNFVPDGRFDGEREDKTKQITLSTEDIDALNWKGVWIEDFLDYCNKERLPVDFVSTHPYPTDNAFDLSDNKVKSKTRKADSVKDDINWLRNVVAKSAYPDAELHLTEWNSSPSPRDSSHDYLQEAAYIVKVNISCIGLTNSLSYWTFTDVFEEGGAGDTIFHGGFGLINYQGIVKPSFHAYRFLNELGNEILHQEEGVIITRHAATKKMTALIWYYPSEQKKAVTRSGSFGIFTREPAEKLLHIGQPKEFSISLNNIGSRRFFEIETLDQTHGFALKEWQKMGSPEPPDRSQTSVLKEAAMHTLKERLPATGGGFIWKKTIAPWTVVLIKEMDA